MNKICEKGDDEEREIRDKYTILGGKQKKKRLPKKAREKQRVTKTLSQDQSTEAKEDSCDFDFFEARPNKVRAIDFDEEDFGGKAIQEIFDKSSVREGDEQPHEGGEIQAYSGKGKGQTIYGADEWWQKALKARKNFDKART